MFVIEPLWVRLLGTLVFAALFLLFISPFFLGIRNIGNIAGTALSILGILFFAANPLVSKLLQKVWENNVGHVVLCGVIGLLCICAVGAVIISGFMLHAANDAPKEENVVVVLGCKVRNGVPSLMLRRRLDAAHAYLTEHPDVPVIVCGGQGPDEAISEAQCMFNYLTEHGIDEARIIREDRSTSTIENLQNAQDILHENDWGDRITIATDGYHQLRASMIADDLKLESDHISAKTSWYLVPTYWVREWMGVVYQLVLG